MRIWLAHYKANGRISCDARFMLFTTATVSAESALTKFKDDDADGETRAQAVKEPLAKSKSVLVAAVRAELATLTATEQDDFFSRITIADAALRITEIPSAIINQHLRTIRRESRPFLFERLEGWWMDQAIRLLAGERAAPITGIEVSDKLSSMAEEYRSDNLPITFRQRQPDEIDVANDPRLFVEQLRALDLSTTRLQNAIIDYYRAFEQRSSWARENLLVSNEIEEYEDRLIDEWTRYRESASDRIGLIVITCLLLRLGDSPPVDRCLRCAVQVALLHPRRPHRLDAGLLGRPSRLDHASPDRAPRCA